METVSDTGRGVESFSWRSLLVGLGVGSILCCTNMYFGLQTGWVTMGSLQSALLGFGFFKMLQKCGLGIGFDAAENTILQTTAVATATMPLSAGFVGIIPAFGQLTVEENPPYGAFTLSTLQLLAWSTALAFFGVFFAVPLREQAVVREKLPFPSGTATAKVIAILHNQALAEGDEDEEDEEDEFFNSLEADEEEPPEPPVLPAAELPSDANTASPFLSAAGAASAAAPLLGEFRRSAGSSAEYTRTPGRTCCARSCRVANCKGDCAHSASIPLLDQAHSGLSVSALEALEEDEGQWERTWAALLWTMTVTMALTIVTNLVPWLSHYPVFDWLGFTAATAWGWELLPSFGYVGQGMIMGPRTTLSMLVGALVGWAFLGPYVRREGWAPGPIDDWGTGAAGWVLWVSLAVMLGDSTTSLAMICISYIRASAAGGSRQQQPSGDNDDDDKPEARRDSGSSSYFSAGEGEEEGQEEGEGLVGGEWQQDGRGPVARARRCKTIPSKWWLSGLLASSVLCTAVLQPMFGMALWEPLLATFLAMLVAVLAVRALGETDLNPVSGVGKLSQVVFALVSPGNVLANLVAGAVAEAGASQAGDIMQSFKAAHLLGVCPRAQFAAALIGSAASIPVSVFAYALYTTAWEIPSKMFPVPTAQIWLSMARLVNGGKMLPNVESAALWSAIAAAALPLLAAALRWCADAPPRGAIVPPRAASALLAVLPSGVGLAVGMYVSPKFTLPRVIGTLVSEVWLRINPAGHENFMIVAASGLVLGEGTSSLILAFIKSISASLGGGGR